MPKTIIAGSNSEGLPISEAVEAGGFIFLSGLVGFDAEGGIVRGGVAAELDSIIAQASAILARAGATLDDVVKVNAYLLDAAEFDAFNARYRTHFLKEPPARITTVAALTIDARVELDMIAYRGAPR